MKRNSFMEGYIVKFKYKKSDGFYTSEKEEVFVEIKSNMEEKE